MRYLAIIVTQKLEDGSRVNWKKISQEIGSLLVMWANLPLNIYGCVNLIKMIVLPKITFLFNAIPLTFDKDDVAKLQVKIGSFIWSSKGPRISWKKLEEEAGALGRGGLALPDVWAYYHAFHLKNFCMLTNKVDWSPLYAFWGIVK